MGSRAASKVTGKPRETRGRPPASTEQPLTRKQELFVKELVSKDGQITLREAAINAGYSATSAHSRAYELTNQHISPHVVAAINSTGANWMRNTGSHIKGICGIYNLFGMWLWKTGLILPPFKLSTGGGKHKATSMSASLRSEQGR